MNKLFLGDCLDVMLGLEDKSVSLILADLPYGTTKCRWDTVIPFAELWKQYRRIIKARRAIVLFGAQPFTSALVMSNIEWFRYEWIWEKERPSNILIIKKQAGRVHESILVFAAGVGVYNPQMMPALRPSSNAGYKSQQGAMNALEHTGGVKAKYSDTYNPNLRYPRSVLKFSRRVKGGKKCHPTQKPVALLEYLIKTYTNEGETVLDNTMGSGSTGVACVNLDRRFIGIEIEPRYFKVAEERIEEAKTNRDGRLF